jgi:DNA polymerase-3 subunit epsilon
MQTSDPRVIIFDVETTGTDKRRDQVIELCMQFGLTGEAPNQVWRIKPDVSISPGAQAVHGISMEDLADCPSFSAFAGEIRAHFAETDVLVGYNLGFDIEMVQAEYARLGLEPLDLGDKTIVDPFRLWQQCEPRSLQDAHRRFVGDEFTAAHSAEADVAATGRVLLGMMRAFGLEDASLGKVSRVCEPERDRWIGPSRHFQWSDDGVPVLAFGKHGGKPVTEIAADNGGGYLRWILDKDFPIHVREICRRALEFSSEDFIFWARQAYGWESPKSTPAATLADKSPSTVDEHLPS